MYSGPGLPSDEIALIKAMGPLDSVGKARVMDTLLGPTALVRIPFIDGEIVNCDIFDCGQIAVLPGHNTLSVDLTLTWVQSTNPCPHQ